MVYLVKLNKKGQMWVLTSLIIAMVVLISWLFFYSGFIGYAQDKSEDNVCLLSVITAANTKVPFIGVKSSFDVKCPISNVDSDAKTKTEVNSLIAEEMKQCWINYGQGKIDYYSDWEWGSATTHCRICSKINFNQNIEPPTYAEFGNYLSVTMLNGQDKTFADFFTGADNSQISLGSDGSLEGNEKIDISKPIYVVFKVEKHNEDIQAIKKALGSNEGVGEGAVIGAGALGGAKIIKTETAKGVASVAGKLVPTIVKKAVGRVAGPAGVGLLLYDAATLSGHAGEFNPSLGVYNVDNIGDVCGDLN